MEKRGYKRTECKKKFGMELRKNIHLVTLKKWGVRLIFIHFSSLIPTMLMLNFAISCLTTSHLPWFMDLTFQVPMQYCSLEHQILLSPPDTSTAKHCFHFGTATSFFLELLVIFLCSTLVAYCIPFNLGAHLQASCCCWVASVMSDTLRPHGQQPTRLLIVCLFMLSMRFSRQDYWSWLPFLSV